MLARAGAGVGSWVWHVKAHRAQITVVPSHDSVVVVVDKFAQGTLYFCIGFWCNVVWAEFSWKVTMFFEQRYACPDVASAVWIGDTVGRSVLGPLTVVLGLAVALRWLTVGLTAVAGGGLSATWSFPGVAREC